MSKEETKQITLDNGTIVMIPVIYKYGRCNRCKENSLIWATTVNDRKMPIEWDYQKKCWVCHFSKCAGKK